MTNTELAMEGKMVLIYIVYIGEKFFYACFLIDRFRFFRLAD